MKNSIYLCASSLILAACVTSSEVDFPAFAVTAAFETPVMASAGDSADDPAIYINTNGGGFIAGTDKQAGLYIYNLDGYQREFMPVGMINNVDLREGFKYQGREYVLLVASDDETNAIVTMLYDPKADDFLTPQNARIATGIVSPYGICLGKMTDGSFHAGVTTKDGRFVQYEMLYSSGMQATKLREISVAKQTEGCAFDDRSGKVYVAVEEGDLSHYNSAPDADGAATEIASIRNYGLKADLEGVTVYEDGADGGYVIVSSQGNNSYGVFKLPDLSFAGRFSIIDAEFDGVTSTDGIAVTSMPTDRFPRGFLVVQDDMDDTSPRNDELKKQNFKIIDWRVIEGQLAK